MFILSPDSKTLTDEQGNGYFIRHLDDGGDAITCYANDAVVFEGTEKECAYHMLSLARRLKALEWHEKTSVLVNVQWDIDLNAVAFYLDKMDDAKIEALGAVMQNLIAHDDFALNIKWFCDEGEGQYDPS